MRTPHGRGRHVLHLLLWVFFCLESQPVLHASEGAAATVHPLATAAALEALENGGNAIDAAVAAALTLGVVDGQNSGIGGGCFVLARLADGTTIVLDGREMAPARSSRDMFVRDGRPVPELSLVGPLAVGVPGELATLAKLAARHGQLPLSRPLKLAARLAESGFPVTETLASTIADEAGAMRHFPEIARIFLHPDGSPRQQGEVLRQPDLAETYRQIASRGIDWFYRGPFAKNVDEWMRAQGGVLRRSDFRRYRTVVREPVLSSYRGFTIVGFPPPSSGGVHVAQILNILEHFNLGAMGEGSADFAHVTAEAMKLAFADRAYWLGDPDFVNVPRGLISTSYAAELAARIRQDRALEVTGHGSPPPEDPKYFRRHTTHFTTVDTEGNWVAVTATINTSFGSKVVVPGTGVVLNNQMDDFAAQPGVPNFFGLIGAEANAVAAKKRPLSSMSPTLVIKDGHPVFTVGGAGGPTIISQVVLAIVRTVDFDSTPTTALSAPRMHHQWRPDELVMEDAWNNTVVRDLERRGHHVRRVESMGVSQAIGLGATGLEAAADARVEGSAGLTARLRHPVP